MKRLHRAKGFSKFIVKGKGFLVLANLNFLQPFFFFFAFIEFGSWKFHTVFFF